MKPSLQVGMKHNFSYTVPENKMVPALYTEAEELQRMPAVFATAFMIGLMEWTAVQLIDKFVDKGVGSVGTMVNVKHLAATPAGHSVTVDIEVTEFNNNKIVFDVRAHDGDDLIGEGTHGRTIVNWDRFNARVERKRQNRISTNQHSA